MALTALRPFVRLSQRLERQVVTPVRPAPAPPAAPAPAPAPTTQHRPAPPAAPAPAPAAQHRPAPPAAEPAPVTPTAPAAPAEPTVTAATPAAPAALDAEETSLAGEQFQAVDASVVPVPIESLNRLVLAVDELGSEMTHVRQAIRELTTALTESQANVARVLAATQAGAGTPDVPDPLDAVTGPYVSGEPTPTPFSHEPPTLAPTARPVAPEPAAPMPAAAPVAAPVPEYAAATAATPDHAGGLAPEHANGLGDLPILSTGAAQVVIGPIASLDELDDAVEHIRRITGVDAVSVTSFEGSNVVLTAELSRALPLASLLRNALGREVASCRLVDGRIVVDFGEAGTRA